MKSQHTPGPWTTGPNAGLYADTNLRECQRICNVGTNTTVALSWHKPTARLIAAAPDLLAAIELVMLAAPMNHPDDDIESFDWVIAARAAIARAKGEPA